MFRTDNAADGTHGNAGGGGVSSRKAHPIFRKKSSKVSNTESSQGGGFWSLFICSINLNNSDPRFRPPICCVIVGVVVMATGIFALVFRDYPVALTSGVIVTAIGAAILIFSVTWIFLTRQKIVRGLERKAAAIAGRTPERCNMNTRHRTDPIMSRGLVGIYYKSCEDTLPPGFRKFPAGTRSVRIPPTDGFMSVESTCFPLVYVKEETKSTTSPRSKKLIESNDSYFETNEESRKRVSESAGRTLPQRPSLTSEDQLTIVPNQKSKSEVRSSRKTGHSTINYVKKSLRHNDESNGIILKRGQMQNNNSDVYRSEITTTNLSH